MEQRRERCSQHPPWGPIWDYPAAASDACTSMASILFCCRTAPRRERTHWSPAAVEWEAWAVYSGLCCPSVCKLSPLPCSLPPEASREESRPGGLCCRFSSFITWPRGGGMYTSFSLHLGSLVCIPGLSGNGESET